MRMSDSVRGRNCEKAFPSPVLSRNFLKCSPYRFRGMPSPQSSLRLDLPILAGTPRNAPTPARAGLVSTSGTGHRSGVPLRLRLRPLVAGGDGLAPRSRPPLAIRRPSTTIRQDRSRSQALRSRDRRPCRAPAGADSFLHSRPVAFAPLLHLHAVRSRSTPRVTLRRRWAAGARSRCTARASLVSEACPLWAA
jgi:hypothetical protein